MTMTLETTSKNAALDAVVDLLDAGAGAGYIKITTSADVVLATYTLSDPACAAASSGSVSFSAISQSGTNAATGTAAKCKFYDSNDVLRFSGSVGTSGEDINFSSVSFVSGETQSIDSLAVTF